MDKRKLIESRSADRDVGGAAFLVRAKKFKNPIDSSGKNVYDIKTINIRSG